MCRSEEPQDKSNALRQTRREETVSTGRKAADCLAPDEAGLRLPASLAACVRAARSDVNPHDVDGTADAINLALAMPLDERVARHDALLRRLRKQDAQAWHRAFIDRLAAGAPAPSASLLEADARTPSTAALCVGSQPTSHRDKEAPSSDQFLNREYEA